jgi:digeranylgeranylglycerophospholipid reductase
MRDVAIIGGGPSGLYAACRLAADGLDVALFEEHEVAGDPVHCTGVLAAEAFDEFGLTRSSVLNPLSTARFFGPSGATIEYTTPVTEAVVIDRLAFDQSLFAGARRAGATVVVSTRVIDITVDTDAVTLVTADNVVRARACILACGANYSLQRRLGLGLPSRYLQSAQLELPADRPGDVEVHFGHDIAPKGFAWVVPVARPHGTFARVGLMCDGPAREHFDVFTERVAARWGMPVATAAPRTKMLPLAPLHRTFVGRVLAVGDAAGLVKATTGGGIYYSLTSARIAADVLSSALRSRMLDENTLSEYERRWQAALGEELAAQLTLRRIADQLSDREIDSLFELAQTNGIMPIVRRTAAFNRHRNLIISLLNHPPTRHVLMRRVLGWGRTA